MRAIVQRVRNARLWIDNALRSEIGQGVVVLVGVGPNDDAAITRRVAEKVSRLRIFDDQAGRMNLSLEDVDGMMLAVSQFTLFADTRKGNRPSFTAAAAPEHASQLFDQFVRECQSLLPGRIKSGIFAANMLIELSNDGPVTIPIDTSAWSRAGEA